MASIQKPRMPLMVYALIAVNALIFFYQLTLSPEGAAQFVYEHALVPRRYFDELWSLHNGLWPYDYSPFLTATFMHAGWSHIILNMVMLYGFGVPVERRIGPFPFLALYLCCALASTVAYAHFNRDSISPVLGASGPVAGILAAFTLSFPYARFTFLERYVPFLSHVPAVIFVWVWFAANVHGALDPSAAESGDRVAWWAHVGGFLAGLTLQPLFLLFAPKSSAPPREIKADADHPD